MKITELLDAAKAAHSIPSDYALAKAIGVTTSAISNVRTGRNGIDDATAIKIAELAGLDAGYVIACAHSERAKSDPERAAWKSIVSRLAGVLFVTPALFFMPTPTHAAQANVITSDVQAVTVIRSRQRIVSALLSALFGPRLAA